MRGEFHSAGHNYIHIVSLYTSPKHVQVCGVKTKSANECINSVSDISICNSVDVYLHGCPDQRYRGIRLLDTDSIVNNIFNEKLPPQKNIKFSVMRGTGSQIIQLAVVSEKL